jgi:hypothetical protein
MKRIQKAVVSFVMILRFTSPVHADVPKTIVLPEEEEFKGLWTQVRSMWLQLRAMHLRADVPRVFDHVIPYGMEA